MLAQKITFDLMQSKLDDIRVVQGDSCREIQFEGSDLDGVLSYEDYTYEFDLMKSDGTFVIQTLSAGILIPTEQMEVITGTHYYSVKIKDADNELVYSGQGAFIVDDNVITEDAIESVAEVNGLVFPDDFLTTDNHFAEIDDTTTSEDSTWSSQKINTEIGNQIEEAIEQIPIPEVSDDYVLNEEKKVGSWLGKDLYRNVVVSQGAWGGGTKTLWNLSGAHLVKWDVLIQNPYWSGTWIIPNGDNSGSLKFWAYGESTNGDSLLCDNLGGYTVSKIYAIVYYTKESW